MVKKLGVFLLGVFAIGMVTGCGNNSPKTLVCTTTENSSGLKMDQEITAVFKGKKVDSLKLTVDSKAEDDAIKENWDSFASILKEQFSGKDAEGIKVTTKDDKKNYSYKVEINVDVTKAADKDLKEFNLNGIADAKDSIDDAKKDLEKAGYTCKIN